ncbi:aminopeptidase C [Adlercreutzia equolifaciens]|uniref:aminopeptidase C n=1 Tax=Adlercreutzia equolifaciens TaxID=446660 RepID=UPI001EDD2F71|nr:C1 family peptidase [Adlercreutzia equolifaciens]MCG4824807.1 aminopeptidase [Adlercreutzia equolifaciens]
MEISKEQIAKMAESYKKAETQHVAQRAVTKNGILESAESVEVLKRMSPKNFAFSIDVDDQAVANQKMSGRCWMFACLNVLRFHIEKELDLPKGTFELSQAYLAFFNKLERAAWFLEHAVATADKPLGDREVDWLFTTPMADGGDWDMVCALVKKYGVVPHEAQAETHCTNNTAELNTVLSHLLRQDALKLRTMAQEDKDTASVQEEMLNEVYRVLAVCFGEPVQKFDFTYNDAKGHYHADLGITPLEFLKKYVPINLDDYIGVINVPGDDKPYGRMYAIQDSDQIPERRNLYLNVPMEELKGYVIDSLKDGEPVWFGSDVLQHCDRNAGVMDFDLYDLEAMFGVKFTMDKAQPRC